MRKVYVFRAVCNVTFYAYCNWLLNHEVAADLYVSLQYVAPIKSLP